MQNYSYVRNKIEDVDRLKHATDESVARLRSGHYPEDYVDFIGQVGFGNLGDLQLYSAPIKPDSIYPSSDKDLMNIVLFGDDFQGYCFGFDLADGMRVVEVDPKGKVSRAVEGKFDLFIRTYFDEK